MNYLDEQDVTLKALDQLKHDLGKYLRMPLVFLAPDASREDLKQALEMALLQTRSIEGGYQPARQLWQSFLDEHGADLQGHLGFTELVSAVDQALNWESALKDESLLDQHTITLDLGRVSLQIATVMGELRDAQ